MKRLAAWLAVALTAITVSGCGSRDPNQVGRDTLFTKDTRDSIMVLGVKSTEPDTVLGIKAGYWPLILVWGRVDPATRAVSQSNVFKISTAQTLLGMNNGGTGETTYHVLRIPPGTYALSQIHTVVTGYNILIGVHEKIGTSTHMTLADGAPFFSIRPGEVRYLGDLHVDASKAPAKLVKLMRNDQPAKAELARYPGIHVRPFFQAPAVLPPSGEAAVAMTVSQ
jgi:hypothetical protein